MLEVGQQYVVMYTDRNYPCRCICHRHPDVRHIMPCCYNRSYVGLATLEESLEDGLYSFRVDTVRILVLNEGDVIRKATEDDLGR